MIRAAEIGSDETVEINEIIEAETVKARAK